MRTTAGVAKRAAGTLALAAVLAAATQAAPITWTGAADGNWNNPGNWDLGRVPAGGDAILLPAGGVNKTQNAMTLGSSSPDDQITLAIGEGGYTLNNAAAALTFGNTLTSVGNNTINCRINHQNRPSYTSDGGTLTFNGTHTTKGLTLYGDGDFLFNSGTVVGGSRALDFHGTGTARFQAALGPFSQVFSQSRAGGVRGYDAGTILLNGTQSAGTLAYGIGGGGTLGGNGLAQVSYSASAVGSGIMGIGFQPNAAHPSGNGTLSPGDPLVNGGFGTFTVTVGDRLVLGSNADATTGTLAVQIGEAGNSDRLVINGNLDLSSSRDVLSLSLAGGVTPSGEYSLFTFTGTRTGVFDTVLLNGSDITALAESGFEAGGTRLQLVYDGLANGHLRLMPIIPEPASLTLAAVLAAALLPRRWRRGGPSCRPV
ncbi:MAG: hypothetical protein BWZ02_01648 [Lentisphaerae bacterium ADurb.BinA184]|nr:MAG: hypothetical protein BWZ02_01648 [Lentisphaerae bacterium ADurb.BinA184]